MKKSLRFMSLLFALAAVLSALTSCGFEAQLARMTDEEKAFALYRKSMEESDKAQAFTMNISASMNVTVRGTDLSMKIKGTTTGYNTDGDFAYTDRTKTVIKSDSVSETIEAEEGFIDGYMFLSTDDVSLRSPLTKDEYIEFMNESSESIGDVSALDNLSAENCSEISCVRNDDGSYRIVFGKLTGDAFDSLKTLFEESWSLPDIGLGITAVALGMDIGKDYMPISMNLDLTMDNDGEEELLKMNFEYTSWGDTKKPTVDDFDSFTEVDDLRAAKKAYKALRDAKASESGHFTAESSQRVVSGAESTSYTETDDIVFNGGDKYTYTISADVKQNGTSTAYTISYKNGKQTVKSGGDSSSSDMTDEEAGYFIASQIDAGSLDLNNISDVEVKADDGGTTVEMKVYEVDDSVYDRIFPGYSAYVSEERAYITISYDKDGRLTEYKYSMNSSVIIQAVSYRVVLTNEVDFSDFYVSDGTPV